MLLLDKGADFNTRDDNGNTALMKASKLGNYQCADLLIQAGADVNIVNSNDETAIEIATEMNRNNSLGALLELGPEHFNFDPIACVEEFQKRASAYHNCIVFTGKQSCE